MKNFLRHKIKSIIIIAATFVVSMGIVPSLAMPVYAGGTCGSGPNAVPTGIDFGCSGKGNPIEDLAFAIIRLMSDGVGIVVIASIVVAGIQYTTSRSDPQAVANAMARIRSSLVALLIFIFGFALIQWLVPGGFFNS